MADSLDPEELQRRMEVLAVAAGRARLLDEAPPAVAYACYLLLRSFLLASDMPDKKVLEILNLARDLAEHTGRQDAASVLAFLKWDLLDPHPTNPEKAPDA